MSAHGPDAETCERASNTRLEPRKIEDTMAFMFESRFTLSLSEYALHAAELQPDYYEAWQNIKRRFPKQIA
jgi:homogentisate 1,2-dioxygenase